MNPPLLKIRYVQPHRKKDILNEREKIFHIRKKHLGLENCDDVQKIGLSRKIEIEGLRLGHNRGSSCYLHGGAKATGSTFNFLFSQSQFATCLMTSEQP
ncbi:hypothetical protein JHK85_031899 [Glycine max]|nr:hypothetical protein JHK85_031899 [Glycine max]